LKRIGNKFEEICSWDNIEAAYREARRGKSSYGEVKWMDTNLHSCLAEIKHLLENEEYVVGQYINIVREEGGKMRSISKLPFFPDRVIHHALLRVMGPEIRKSYIRDTYQSIPGRGTSDARKRIRKFIRDNQPAFYLQLDIRKYYPSVDHSKLKEILTSKVKCRKTLSLFYTVIDSHEGLPIGNYTSQDLGNLNLTPFDWFIKQELGVKGYFRYCDDLVFMGDTKEELEYVRLQVISYLEGLNLVVKDDYELKPMEAGLDFIGYVFYPTGVRLRTKIYQSAVDALEQGDFFPIASYYGWLLPTKHNELKEQYASTIKRKKIETRENSQRGILLVG
jgi:RNA-directed DNA polymerase